MGSKANDQEFETSVREKSNTRKPTQSSLGFYKSKEKHMSNKQLDSQVANQLHAKLIALGENIDNAREEGRPRAD